MQETLPRLIIDRSEGERVVIGDPLDPIGFVEVIKVHGAKRVRMSFMFNKDIKVNREEIVHPILRYAEDIKSKTQ
jgi:sRNA-binding carbon storage regulator CsrA